MADAVTLPDEQRDAFLEVYGHARRGDTDGLASAVDRLGSIDIRFTVRVAAQLRSTAAFQCDSLNTTKRRMGIHL